MARGQDGVSSKIALHYNIARLRVWRAIDINWASNSYRIDGEKGAHIIETDGAASGGQSGKDLAAVALGVDAGVEEGHDAAIVASAQEATEPLFELEDG